MGSDVQDIADLGSEDVCGDRPGPFERHVATTVVDDRDRLADVAEAVPDLPVRVEHARIRPVKTGG